MLDPKNSKRFISGACKTDCIMLLLNLKAFDILIKDKMKKDREMLAMIVYNSVPNIQKFYTFPTVLRSAHFNFKAEKFCRDAQILKEGGTS